MRRKLFVVFALSLLVLGFNGIGHASLTDGLVAYYPFNGNANDESGNGRNGTIYGATLVADQNGVPNQAYYFNGINNYIYWGKVLPDMTTMTIALWVNSENESTIVCDGDWATANDIVFGVNSKPSIVIRADKKGYTLANHVSISSNMIGVWRHIVWVMTSVESKVYVDGLLAGTITVGGSNVGYHNFIVGTQAYPQQNSFGWAGYWKGAISDLRVYNRTISDSEIQELYSGRTCYDTGYAAGVAACLANPASCGINVNGGDAVTLTPDLKMHLPNIQYNTLFGIESVWADLTYDATKTDGSYFKVTGAGTN